MRREPYSEGKIACMSFAIVGYAFGAALLRLILFEALPKVPQPFWLHLYCFVAGAVFALMVRKIHEAE